jgi:hypothetical protein
MFMRAGLILVLCVVACHRGEPLERLPPPRRAFEIRVAPPPPPPPPPPGAPAPLVTVAGPPDELSPVLEPQDELPVVRLYELTDRGGEDSFLGYGIRRRKRLEDVDARKLVERLSADNSFVDSGDYGCVGDPIGVRIARGDVVRDIVVDCGHVYFTPSRHDGRFELLAPAVNELIYSLR